MTDPIAIYTRKPRVAYFSMEIAVQSEIPTYAGGLGILAGDTMRAAADLELPMVGITLVSRAGYFRQTVNAQGVQSEHPASWEPADHAVLTDAKVAVHLEGRRVWIQAWLYRVKGEREGSVPVFFLDTDLPENAPEDRELTHYLYGGDEAYRLKQEVVLGIGGARLLYALEFTITQYHMNEGHSALLALELAKRATHDKDDMGPDGPPYDIADVRAQCNFTTHTPVDAGHDQFSYDLVNRVLGDDVNLDELKRVAGRDRLNMTQLALSMSDYVNGVAKKHAEISANLYRGYRVHAISNGVHPFTWTSRGFARLYDRYLPGWCHDPGLLVQADQIPDELIWQAHMEAKSALTEFVSQRAGVALDKDRLIMGFARRMTAYKRPDLLYFDTDALMKLSEKYPLQLVFAGKAHPRDTEGKRLIEELYRHHGEIAARIPAVFIADYDMSVAQVLVSGVDLWLNTPRPPMEASGTSGMKASLNGIPSLSVLDGWWLEGCIAGVTGWPVEPADGNEAAAAGALYERLREDVLPLYYGNRSGWIAVMKGAITKNGSRFTSHRMLRRYVSEAYLK